MKNAVMEQLMKKHAEEEKRDEKETSCDQELGEEEPHTEDPDIVDVE